MTQNSQQPEPARSRSPLPSAQPNLAQSSVQSQEKDSPPNIPPTVMPPLPKGPHMEEKKHGLPAIFKILLAFLITFLVIGSFAFLLTHIVGNKGNGKVTLTYWGLWEDENLMQGVISDFERANPNITVVYSKQDPKQYSERLLTRIQNGTGPDIFRFHNSWIPMVSSVLAPLPTDTITLDEFKKNYYPVIQQDLIQHGAILGIPLEIDTLSLFVNTQLFQSEKLSIPTTWPDFITISKALTTRDTSGKIKIAGAALGTYDNITHAPDIVSLLFAQNGVNLKELDSSSQNAGDALTFYASFAKNDGNVWDNTLDPSVRAFANGSLAMYFGYSWDIFSIKALNPNIQMSVNPVPHLPGRDMTIASYWVEGVSNKSKNQKAAMLFMKFLSSKETAQKIYSEEAKTRTFGEPYARVDLADSLKDTNVAPFLGQAKNAVSSYFAGETQDTGINGQMNGYLGNAVRSMLGNNSVQSALDTLTKGYAQVLEQYVSTPTKP